MRKYRVVALLVLAAAVGGCRSSRRISVSEEQPGVDPLRQLVGQKLILRHFGDRKDVVAKPGESRKGTCDVAVTVTDAAAVPDGARLVLSSLGRVRVGDAPTVGRCGRLASPIALTLKGINVSRPEEWRPFLATILAPSEAYLTSHGRNFKYAAEPEPKIFANRSPVTDDEGRRLATRVTAWPKPLLAVEPAVASPGGKVHHEGEVEFSAVVGADGRVFKPHVKTSLNDEHTHHVASVLTLWRFEPAREGDRAVPALYEGRTVFRIY
jgi:hypothetical protein